MFPPGAMDPEMMRLAQEQLSRMTPEDMQRMQQMMTPEMMRKAQEQMQHMTPEQMRMAAQQMGNLSPSQVANMAAQLNQSQGATRDPGGAVPPAGMASYMSQRQQYEYTAALNLKNEGNNLHGLAKYQEAMEKYTRARANLILHTSPDSVSLRRVCSVNLMSCYLKTGGYSEAVEVGNQVLSEDSSNFKARYRRGVAHKELGNLKAAERDLSRASELAPDETTVAEILREVRSALAAAGSSLEASDTVIVEDVTEEEEERARVTLPSTQPQPQTPSLSSFPPPTSLPGGLPPQMDADTIRTMQQFMQSMDPAQIASLSGGAISPDMARTAASLMSSMKAEELQRVMAVAATVQGQGQAGMGGPLGTGTAGSAASAVSQPGGLTNSDGSTSSSSSGWQGSGVGVSAAVDGRLPDGGAALQETLMKDPAAMEMMSNMMQQMSAEDIAAMGERMGAPMSVEQAEQARKFMSSLPPERLATMLQWSQRAQHATRRVQDAVRWVVSRRALVIAIILLILAILLQYFGVFQ